MPQLWPPIPLPLDGTPAPRLAIEEYCLDLTQSVWELDHTVRLLRQACTRPGRNTTRFLAAALRN